MRVLLASHRYFPVPGGTERHVQLLAEGLARRGHSATVLTQSEPGVPREETLNGVRVARMPVRSFAGIRWPLGYLKRLRSLGADVFHLTGNRIWCADFYFPFARRFDWPQVLTGLGFYQYAMHPTRFDRWYFERYLPRQIAKFDRYTALTGFERDQLLGWGVPAERIAWVPTGIALGEFASPPRPPAEVRHGWGIKAPNVAVYAGGFFENKRVDRLVDAVARTNGRWGLVVVGRDRPESPYSAAAMATRANAAGVEFVAPGALTRAETVSALFAADAVVLGSEYEGFGIVLLEAMAAARPFVAFPSAGAAELAATGGGILVSTVEECAGALTRLEDAGVRSELGRLGRAAVVEYTDDRMVDRFVEVYERAVSARSARRAA